MDKKYICPCGLICTDCLFYKPEIYDTAVQLRDAIEHSQLDIFLEGIAKHESWKAIADHLHAERDEMGNHLEKFRTFSDFMHVLDGLVQLRCTSTCRESGGCSMGGTSHTCDAAKCVQSKGYEGCWECSESSTCAHLTFVKQAYGETIHENFTTITEHGYDAVQSHGKNYYAWQRKRNM
ncbi:DUF3795 domain-containing protein [Desulfovibrio inopinatus]|uniref:DUF3795 domain-containing protein n=1 Tax=Desulfovibrio inopinatus TaxID=102109 RepID=UPI00047F0FC6|nr:DUF3795 domain-containing protein [Desulfovibrio inopinatus]